MPSTSVSDLPISVHCRNLREAQIAIEAIVASRNGTLPPNSAPAALNDPEAARSARIEAALRTSPIDGPKEVVLRILVEAAPKHWVKFSEMQAEFGKKGIQLERASAAIRDLSSLMGRLPAEDIAGLRRHIEVLAERTRSEGEYRYRLTQAGRLAVERVFAAETVES